SSSSRVPPRSPVSPYSTPFRSARHLGVVVDAGADAGVGAGAVQGDLAQRVGMPVVEALEAVERVEHDRHPAIGLDAFGQGTAGRDRKSTRLNSSHVKISYAVFC